MGRPRRPQWISWGEDRRGYWRTKIEGVFQYEKTIGRDEKPQIDGIPARAWDWLRHLESGIKATQEVAPAVLSVGRLLTLYCDWAESEASSGGSMGSLQAKNIRSRGKLFLHFSQARQTPAEALSVDTLAAFFGKLREEGYSKHYCANVGRTIRAAFTWGAKPIAGRNPTRLLGVNPIEGYDFPRAPKNVREHIEGDTVRRFLRWAWARARRETKLKRHFERVFVLMLRFQRLTGCRPGEACDTRWEDLIWGADDRPRVVIPAARQKTGRRTGKDRVIYLTAPSIRILEALARHPGRHETHVFPHMRGKGAEGRGHHDASRGEPWPSGSAASAKVRTLRVEAIAAKLDGIDGVGPRRMVAYANRHGYASEGIAAGYTDEQVASLLGNSPEMVRQTYQHAVTDAESSLADELHLGRRRKTS